MIQTRQTPIKSTNRCSAPLFARAQPAGTRREAAEISKLSLCGIAKARRWKCVWYVTGSWRVFSSLLKQQHSGGSGSSSSARLGARPYYRTPSQHLPDPPAVHPPAPAAAAAAAANRASQHYICSISEKSPARRLSAHRRSLEPGGGGGRRSVFAAG